MRDFIKNKMRKEAKWQGQRRIANLRGDCGSNKRVNGCGHSFSIATVVNN